METSSPVDTSKLSLEIPSLPNKNQLCLEPNSITYGKCNLIQRPVAGNSSNIDGDGIDFNTGTGATYLGQKLDCSIATFNNQEKATHPFAKDTSGNLIVITGPTGSEGNKLVSCKLPFGSFVSSQPEVKVTDMVQK